jgi:FkbM family methyltransferase
MIADHIQNFLRKSWTDRFATAEFKFRQGLAKLPYIPVPLHVRVSPLDELTLKWSYVVPFHDPDKGFFDYWAGDLAELQLLWKLLKPGMVFLDIGAYHGIYSLVAAKRLGSTGQVVAFEPSPRERRRLDLHLRWNGIRTVRVESCAVSSGMSNCAFFQVVSGDTTRNGLRPPASTDAVREVPIKTVSLDQYISDTSMRRVDIIKLDVEGAELDTFRGATKVLTELRPIFICEVLDATSQVWGYEARQTISTLKAFDFDWFEIGSDGTLVPHEMKDSYPRVQNYLAVPREKRSSFTGAA